MGLVLVTEPTDYPVGLATVKKHLRVEHDDDDTIIEAYIAAETAFAEKFTGRAFAPQTWDYYQDAFPDSCDPQEIRLPIARVTDVAGVFYQDTNGDEQTLATSNYDVDLASIPARVSLSATGSWPAVYDGDNAVRIRFTAGSEDTGVSPATPDVLRDLQLAIMLRVQADYDGGEQAAGLRAASEIFLKNRRVVVSLG